MDAAQLAAELHTLGVTLVCVTFGSFIAMAAMVLWHGRGRR